MRQTSVDKKRLKRWTLLRGQEARTPGAMIIRRTKTGVDVQDNMHLMIEVFFTLVSRTCH